MYPFLFLVGLAAGLVDAIAGGGGVISLPVLLNLGCPVPLALGTNKLQASFGSVAATVHYARAGLIEASMVRLGVPPTLIGAGAGAVCVQYIDGRLLAQTRADFRREPRQGKRGLALPCKICVHQRNLRVFPVNLRMSALLVSACQLTCARIMAAFVTG